MHENHPPGRLRKVTREDAENLLAWRNHDDIRKFMHNSALISWADHIEWLEIRLSETDKPDAPHLYVYEAGGKPCGFMKFEPDRGDASLAEWGFYKAPDASPGTGTAMCRAALDLGFGQLGFARIVASVLPFNAASLKLHERLGFTKVRDRASLPEMDAASPLEIRFEITRQQWLDRQVND